MQNTDDLIKDLFNGRIFPAEKAVKKGSEYHNKQLEIIKMKEDLYSEIADKKLEKKIEKLTGKFTELSAIYCEETFKDGFCLAIQIIIESYKNDRKNYSFNPDCFNQDCSNQDCLNQD
ncbi:MAG: hypothetical protein R3Y35_14815 [Clostridia bacterium]